MPDEGQGERAPRPEAEGPSAAAWLLEAAQGAAPDGVGRLAADAAVIAGFDSAAVYLVDHEQACLRPLPVDGGEPLTIDTTLAGRAFVTEQPQTATGADSTQLWLPLLDGSDRLGVVVYGVATLDDAALHEAERLTAAISQLVVSKAHYTDSFHLSRRSRPMTLGADLVWSQLPPQSFVTSELTVAAVLAPAYDLGGDAYDYALNEGVLDFAVFDAMGHGTPASLLATLTLGAYRHGRRQGHDLASIGEELDAAIALTFPDQFVTGYLGRLHAAHGQLHLLNCGHHPPLLVRGGRVASGPEIPPRLPLGLGPAGESATVVSLEPGDRLLFFTDGVVEAHASAGDAFGRERLSDMLGRETLSALPPAETLRRLSHAVLDHLGDGLRDDATLLFVEWRAPASA